MSALSALPARPLGVTETQALAESDAIDIARPLWGHLTGGLTVVGALPIVGQTVHLIGYDRDREPWQDVARLAEIDVTDPDSPAAAVGALERWIREHSTSTDLTRVTLDFGV